MLGKVDDKRELSLLVARIERLANNPEVQGKALTGELRGHRSVRAAGQRYRIAYRIVSTPHQVVVVAVGRRKEGDKGDVYARLARVLGRR